MKLLNFKVNEKNYFGMVKGGLAVSFVALQSNHHTQFPDLDNIYAYLENLPQSFEHASLFKDLGTDFIKDRSVEGAYPLSEVRVLPPIPRPSALLDFGLTPRHLLNSTRTMLKYEWGSLMSRMVTPLVKKRFYAMCSSGTPPYYKGNHLTIIGDYDEIGWPSYTSYLDIEPELAIVTGNARCRIAGYLIFNDASARDIQFPEMIGLGPARSKDFFNGNGLGPFLVTPDEIPDPLSLHVTVKVGTRFVWRGSTSEYVLHPEKLAEYFQSIYPFVPGTVLGMGTVPDCTGLDNDQWINPGELIEITFDGLGTLHQRIPDKPGALEKSRWPARF
jgi:2-keto-4-pentenoate hydratase/2-oxohepta-3-ene-1,7-dioic acid hydratase in catechol pathway